MSFWPLIRRQTGPITEILSGTLDLLAQPGLLPMPVVLFRVPVTLSGLSGQGQACERARGRTRFSDLLLSHAGVPVLRSWKTRSAIVAATAIAAPIRNATCGPSIFHQTPKRTDAGRAARPTLAWKAPKARPRRSGETRSATSARSAPSVSA